MAQVFQQSLAQQDPYSLVMAQLAQQQEQPPMFTPEQQRERIRRNNQITNLGLLGQLSGDSNIQNVGGQVFKQALGDRQEIRSQRGVTDPLTGETSVDPAYAEEKNAQRQGRVLEAALRFQDQRERAGEREQQNAQRAQDREDQIRLQAGLRGGLSAAQGETAGLRNDLLRAQIADRERITQQAQEKAAESQRKVQMMATNASSRADELVKHIDTSILPNINRMTTGFVGSQLRKIPGTDAYNLDRAIDRIKANIGFQELAQMRLESPTGGALGQVAVQELMMLQATLGSLETAQSPEELAQTSMRIKQHFMRIRDSLNPNAGQVSPASPDTSAPPGSAGTPPAQPGTSATPPPAGEQPPQRRRMRMNAQGVLEPVR